VAQALPKTTKPIAKKPKRFEVILLNDDYTTMEFVIKVLKRFFNKKLMHVLAYFSKWVLRLLHM